MAVMCGAAASQVPSAPALLGSCSPVGLPWWWVAAVTCGAPVATPSTQARAEGDVCGGGDGGGDAAERDQLTEAQRRGGPREPVVEVDLDT